MSNDLDVHDVPDPWRNVEVHPSLGSTNDRARELGEPWNVVVTDHQQQGRGRLARAWETPPGVALTVSLTVPLEVVPAPGIVPLLTGLAVARAVDGVSEGALRPVLKWPNDVLVGPQEGKLCGILCELVPGLLVIGIGVNVRQSREQLPVETAASLLTEGVDVPRSRLLTHLLEELPPLLRAPREEAMAAYRQRCATIGREVRVHLPGDTSVEGVVDGVDDDGCLRLRRGTEMRSYAAGDVVHVRPAS